MKHLEIAQLLESRQRQIVDDVVEATMKNSFWIERFGEEVREKILFDTEYNVSTIVKAARYRSPMILEDYVLWLRKTLVDLRCSTGMVRETFVTVWNAISAHMPSESLPLIYRYIVGAVDRLAYDNPAAQQLSAVHEQLAGTWATRIYEQHWHWQAAYGRDGQARVRYECWMCLDYLIDSLGMHNEHVLIRHVLWERDRTLQRGLSTTHIQHWLWTLAGLVEEQLPPNVIDGVSRVLQTCAASLLHESESYRALLSAQDTIVSEVAQTLVAHRHVSSPEQAAMDTGWYLAYLGDSVARRDSAYLVGYTRWMQHWCARAGMPDTVIRTSYQAIAESVERHLPRYAAHEARTILQAANQVL